MLIVPSETLKITFVPAWKLTQCICTFIWYKPDMFVQPTVKISAFFGSKNYLIQLNAIKSNDHMLLDSVDTSTPGIHESLWTVGSVPGPVSGKMLIGEEDEY